MKTFLLAFIAMLSIAAGAASAATPQARPSQQQGDAFNWLEGGGG